MFDIKKIIRHVTCYMLHVTRSKGFTLIEMLVVIFIIAILAAGIVSISSKSQKQARDTKRKADLQLLSAALEMYYTQNKTYPVATSGTTLTVTSCAWSVTSSTLSSALVSAYMQELPKDPLKKDKDTSSCTANSLGNFYYLYKSDGTTYTLCTALENANDPEKGNYSASDKCSGAMFQNGYMIKSQ